MSFSTSCTFIPEDITMNFSGDMVIVSNSSVDGNKGAVAIYNYDETNDTFSSPFTISGPSTDSYFGKSVDIDWDGTRIVVGANAISTVYIYDYISSDWVNSSTLSSTIGSDFGYSLSISKDAGDIIAVGAPQDNKVYIYEMLTKDLWTVSNVLNGSHIENFIGYNSTTNLILKSQYNRYGECVKLSGYGDHIIVGQPGTILTHISAGDATNFNIVEAYRLESDGRLQISTSFIDEYYSYFHDMMYRQEGSVQIFKTDSRWYLSNTQVGSTLYGERNCRITDSERRTSGGWSPSGFGMNVSISLNGTLITIGAPLFSVKGGNYEIHNGKIYTYTLDTEQIQDWNLKHSETGNRQHLYGLSFALDYEGTRLATIPRNNKFGSSLNLSDWNGTDWYDVQDVQYFFNLLNTNKYSKLNMTNGKIIYILENELISRYKFPLTQSFQGNSLFTGYISTPQLYVGTNDSNFTASTTSPANSKVISFGGSYGENTYDSTTIENRIYETYVGTFNTAGKSELLLSKTNKSPPVQHISGGGIDFIRLKANEIRLDYHESGIDSKYDRTPVLVCNYRGNIGIKIPETTPDTHFRGTTRTKANMDINGSVYVRNKLTLCDSDRSNIISKEIYPVIIWDTRKPNTVQGSKVYSNNFGDYETTDRSATMSGNMGYQPANFAFYFEDASGQITTDNKEQYIGEIDIPETNFWVKLTKPQSTKSSPERIATIGDVMSTKNGSINITSSGIELNYRNGECVFSNTAVFQTNVWYHLNAVFARSAVVPTTGNTSLKINNSQVTLTPTGTTTTDYDMNSTGQIHFTLGSGISNAYVGMVSFGLKNDFSPQSSDWYNNGPPDEILAVGGGATISGKLGVGVTNPTEALEVAGNVYVRGHMRNLSPKFYVYEEAVDAYRNSYGLVNFNNTRVNFGNHYDLIEHRFTAPVAGTYEFKFMGLHIFSSGVLPYGFCDLSFHVNGNNVVDSDDHDGLSRTVVTSEVFQVQNIVEIMLDLNAGDRVEPYVEFITTGTVFFYGRSVGFFSGKLLG